MWKIIQCKPCLIILTIVCGCVCLSALTVDAAKLHFPLSEAGKRMTSDYRLFKVVDNNYSGLENEVTWQQTRAKQYSLVHRKKPYYELTDAKGKVLWKKDLPVAPPHQGYDGIWYPSEETIAQIDENKGEKVALLYDKTHNRYFFMDKASKETFMPDNSGLLQSYGEKYGKYWLFLEERGFHRADTVRTYFPQGRGYLMFYPESGEIRQGVLPALPNYFTSFVSTPDGNSFFFLYHYQKGWETAFFSVADSVYKVCSDINHLGEYAFSPSGDVAIIRTYNNMGMSENNLIVDAKTGETLGKITNTKYLGAVADKLTGLAFVSAYGQNLLINYLTGQLVFTMTSDADSWGGDKLEISADGSQLSCKSSMSRIYYRRVQE